MNCNSSERQWELAVVFLRLVLASVPLLRLKPALMIDWLEDRTVNRLTPMIALSSAMLTCLDLSTAWATWCWCCKNTQIHTWSMNKTKQLIEKIFKDREQTYKTTPEAKPATRQHLSLWKPQTKQKRMCHTQQVHWKELLLSLWQAWCSQKALRLQNNQIHSERLRKEQYEILI